MTVSEALQAAQKYVRRSNPGSSGAMRVKSSGLPHREQGGRRLSTNLYFGTSDMALNTAAVPVESESIPQAEQTSLSAWSWRARNRVRS
jgi:hypothetical protein